MHEKRGEKELNFDRICDLPEEGEHLVVGEEVDTCLREQSSIALLIHLVHLYSGLGTASFVARARSVLLAADGRKGRIAALGDVLADHAELFFSDDAVMVRVQFKDQFLHYTTREN